MPLFLSGRLFHQFAIDAYSRIEKERLYYLQTHQKDLCGKIEDYNPKIVRLPSTFIGGPRFINESFQDSMAIIRKYGRPSLFITFTANPKWQEIANWLLETQNPTDRPDIVNRVFNMKQRQLLKEIKSGTFGEMLAYTYTIEFQKRGLPHSHNLLFLKSPLAITDIDELICAELPPIGTRLHEYVKRFMIHTPCDTPGNHACHVNGVCKHGFPKPFQPATTIGDNDFIIYRKRNKIRVKLHGRDIGDEWVVPFSPYLLQRFEAHINVEVCAAESSMKYLFKYLHKGVDMAVGELASSNEIKDYIAGRYLSASESFWRLYSMNVYKRSPAVTRLAVHLEGQV